MDYPSACPLQVGLNCPLYPLAGPMWSVMLQVPWVSPPPPSKFSMLPPGSWAGKNRSQPLCWINQIEDAPLCIPQCPRLHPKCSLPSPGNDLGVGDKTGGACAKKPHTVHCEKQNCWRTSAVWSPGEGELPGSLHRAEGLRQGSLCWLWLTGSIWNPWVAVGSHGSTSTITASPSSPPGKSCHRCWAG